MLRRGPVGLLWGVLAPLRALVSPNRFFSQLRGLLDEYGIYVAAVVYFGAWLASSVAAFILLLLAESLRSLASLSLQGLLLAPARALIYSFVFPVVPALVDAVLIAIVLSPFPRERPLTDVFAVRASSLLPYTLRVVILGLEGKLSLASLVSYSGGIHGLALLGLGAALTIIGLRRTLGTSWAGAVVAGAAPLAYKLAIPLI